MRHMPLLAALVASFAIACAARGGPVAPPTTDAGLDAPPPTTREALERVAPTSREGARIVLSRALGSDLAVVADADGNAVRAIDLGAAREIASVTVRAPGDLVLLEDGRVAVAAGEDDAILLVELRSDRTLAIERRIATVRAPRALALSPDDATLAVAGDDTNLAFVRVADGAELARGPTREMPRALAFTDDGARALVGHAAASDLVTMGVASGAASATSLDATLDDAAPVGVEVQMEDDAGHKFWAFGNGSSTMWMNVGRRSIPLVARHGYAFARSGSTLFLAHEMLLPSADAQSVGMPPAPAAGYGGAEDLGAAFLMVSMVDAKQGKAIAVRRTEGECHLPRAARYDVPTETLFVACLGSDTVVPFRRFEGLGGTPGNLTRPVGGWSFAAMARLPTCAGPEGLALDSARDRLVVTCGREGALTVFPLAKAWSGLSTKIAFARTAVLEPSVERGRTLFHRTDDRRIATDGRACATCHVEGLADGLTWKTPQGLRNTPFLAGRLDRQGPFGWSGRSATLALHVARTIHDNLGGSGLPDTDVADLTAYLATLVRVRSPSANDTTEAGREVFAARDCALCHSDRSLSDGEAHDVRSGGRFVTPSLRGVGRSAPYFHDGRYPSLEQVLDRTHRTMGLDAPLPAADRDALAAYLRTL